MPQRDYESLRDSLRVLSEVLPALSAGAGAPPDARRPWLDRLRHTVLPAIDFSLPVLLVGICGGGSTGKSTLLNLLSGRPLSQVGFRAGLTTRVMLVGHPEVLSGPEVAEALLHRLGERPVPWERPEDTVTPGPPLYATSEAVPRSLLYIDTPDFDTGEGGRLVNRERAEPILRTAEVIVYVFTNTVYNNLSNTRFMAEMVGGIGGRPIVLVYRISRAAPDAEVLEHCRVVGQRLYGGEGERDGFPAHVVGVYRSHESDAVALGQGLPTLEPIGEVTAGRPLETLLADLDVAAIKRHAFSGDLATIREGAADDLHAVDAAARQAALYRRALEHVMTQHAVEALSAFPVNEAVSLATRLFLETSPTHIRILRGTGRVVGAPLRAAQGLARRVAEWSGAAEPPPPPRDLHAELGRSLLEAANALRNRLVDDHLIVRVGEGDDLYRAARAAVSDGSTVESLGGGAYNLHVPVPQAVQREEEALLNQDWEAITRTLRAEVPDLVGLPEGVTEELREQVRGFRSEMPFGQRLRELFFASLSALPPLLGVSYTLLTANPVAGAGIWIQIEGLFGVNDLWALVSIPASAGLSDEERKQLEAMITPVFRVWLERRAGAIVDTYARTVCRPALEALEGIPTPDDPRLAQVRAALSALDAAPHAPGEGAR
ncbi:MAG: hypothetical protein GX649_08125 [Chloroflexi bacterium]|nr:hypothetical protein [Chloroflexota bacterium]